jgi:hypothetical protein
MRPSYRVISLAAIVAIAAGTLSAAEAARRPKKQEDAAPVSTPGDKRDRTVTAPGSPFNGRVFWQAAAQCGGIYFRLNTIYAEGAITAKITKPDPAAFTKLSKDADGASTTATIFFEMAERILIADRKLERSEAVLVYDVAAQNAGDRLKSADAAIQATKPCPELYKVCHGAFPQICPDTTVPTN